MQFSINRKTYTIVYLAFLTFHLALSFSVNTPIIYADEAGYIFNARSILFGSNVETKYAPGYSVFLLPAFLINNNIQIAYKIIQVLNSILMSLIPVGTIWLTKFFHRTLKDKTVLLIAIVTSLYPSFILFSNMAMSEALLIPLYLIIVLTFSNIQTCCKTKKKYLLIAALLFFSTYAVYVHPRSAVIFPALLITTFINALYWIRKNKSKRVFFISIIVLIIAFLISSLFIILFGLKGTGYANNLSSKLAILLSASGLKKLLITLNGQILYLILATFGLSLLGLLKGINYLAKLSNLKENIGKYNVILFVTISFVLEVLLSSWFMISPTRADHYFYGRYNEAFLLPVILLGFLAFISMEKKKHLYRYVFILIIFSCLFSAYIFNGLLENMHVAWLNIFGVYAYNVFFSEFNIVHLILFYFLLTAIVFSNRESRRRLSVFLIGFLFSVSTLYANHDFYRNHSIDKERQASLTKPLKIYQENNGDIIVNLDKELFDTWHYYNYMVYIPDIKMNIIDLSADKPVGDLILTNRMDIDEVYVGATIVGIENLADIKMWLLPGRNLDYFKSIGFVASDNFPGPLPNEAFHSLIELYKKPKIGRNNVLQIPTQIQHMGSTSFWPNIYALRNHPNSVRIGAIIYRKETMERIYETRAELPHVVYPGEVVKQDVLVDLNKIKEHLTNNVRSEYIIRICLVQEQVAWFYKFEDNTLDIKLTYDGKSFVLDPHVLYNASSDDENKHLLAL